MSEADRKRFLSMRKRIFDLIGKELEKDPVCKSYEGSIEVVMEYNDYFESYTEEPSLVCIIVNSYRLCQGRREKFEGRSWEEALNRLALRIIQWEAKDED